MKWRIHLLTGAELRQTINDGGEDLESCKETLSALEKCYQEIENKIDAEAREEISCELETVQEHIRILNLDDCSMEDALEENGFYGWNQPLECVNDDLETFYNICDDNRIWVGGI